MSNLTAASASVAISLDLSCPPVFKNVQPFEMGTSCNPAGRTLTANGVSVLENGTPILPVMGEFHYTRYPRVAWRDALLKIKAGGITIVATYVFWIHHEEIEGQYNWSSGHDLHAFAKACGEVGLRCVVRVGPWCHGEVRNGGLPEWLIDKVLELRTNHSAYLVEAKKWYSAIADQLRGALWKDGGPVIGVQIENEYHGDPAHLLALREIAIEAGLDVPFYTRTGWPELTGPIEFGKLLPLYGGYAEGFWDRELTTMPGRYWKEFVFKTVRTDAAIANEQFGQREARDEPGAELYPYLTCEIGGGMMCSYHRRINVVPTDALSLLITKLGSGSNLPGYYMYHGGTNPAGHEAWLQEHQATRYTNYNDLPVKTYDFQTAIGEFGQIRPQYHLLRPVHLFLADFGHRLTTMAAVLPKVNVTQDDTQTLRFGVRTDGRGGFVFINNYQRGLSMPAKRNTQFSFKLKTGELTFPNDPVTVPADTAFFWPFNFDLGDGVSLAWATAQLICQIDDDDTRYTLFGTTGEIAEFAFETAGAAVEAMGETWIDGRVVVKSVVPGHSPVATITAANGKRHCILLLSEADTRACWKGRVAGRDRVILAEAGVIFEDHALRLSTESAETTIAILPPIRNLTADVGELSEKPDGLFSRITIKLPADPPFHIAAVPVQPFGILRPIRIGTANVAEQPADADFDQAAVWRVALPGDVDLTRRRRLSIRYTGDVARIYAGNRLLTDNFYNGTPFEIGLDRYSDVMPNGLTLKILPMQRDAPIYMLDGVRPQFHEQNAVADVLGIDVIESRTIKLSGTIALRSL